MTHALIVDDNKEDRDLLKTLLEFNGYRVTAAGDGLEALAAARSDRPDVIVSDVLMPRMDGFVLRKTWMQDAALNAVPFIFYTANLTSREDEHVGIVLGAARYLIKPMESEVFLRALRAALEEWAGHSRPQT